MWIYPIQSVVQTGQQCLYCNEMFPEKNIVYKDLWWRWRSSISFFIGWSLSDSSLVDSLAKVYFSILIPNTKYDSGSDEKWNRQQLSVNNDSLCFATKFSSTSELQRRRANMGKNTQSSHSARIQQLLFTQPWNWWFSWCDVKAFHFIFYYYLFKRTRKRQSTWNGPFKS